MELESFELVLLRRPANPAQYDEATFDGIQRAHLAYHATLRVSGDIVTNGPVTDQRDEAFRGLTIYRAGSLERARELAEADPAVRAGRLEIEAMHWLCPPSTMRLHGRTVSLDND